jgi:hypothetical protein
MWNTFAAFQTCDLDRFLAVIFERYLARSSAAGSTVPGSAART